MAILPKKRFGCLGRFVKCAAVLLALLAAFVYWNFFRTPPLKISKETTYITEPLTSDGTWVDYFAALEKLPSSPEMKAENNGYRLIVRALGDVTEDGLEEAHLAQTTNSSIDGTNMKFLWLMEKIVLLFINKNKMLNETLSPGFKIPKKGEAQFIPDPSVSTEEGLASLHAAIERCQTEYLISVTSISSCSRCPMACAR
jgi:hypothetical protein